MSHNSTKNGALKLLACLHKKIYINFSYIPDVKKHFIFVFYCLIGAVWAGNCVKTN